MNAENCSFEKESGYHSGSCYLSPLATVSVAAGVYIRWSDGLKEKLQLTKAQEEELEETGAAKSTGVSCTSQESRLLHCSITDQNFSQLAFSGKRILSRNERTARI